MSSSDALQHQQLAMFIPAGELRDQSKYAMHGFEQQDIGGPLGVDEVYARKLEESKQPWATDTGEHPHGGGVWNSLSYGAGVETPVQLVSRPDIQEHENEGIIHLNEGFDPVGLVRDGYHRIAAAADIDPKMEVPVQWNRNIHWEHDHTGRPADPPKPPRPPTPWDYDTFKWLKDPSGHPQKYETDRDEETGQIGMEWHHRDYETMEPSGRPISENTLARLRDHEDIGD